MVNDDSFESMKGKSKHEMWFDLTDMIAKNPDKACSASTDLCIHCTEHRTIS